MDVSTPPSLDLACPQAEADNDKYVHMFRGRGVDKIKYGHEGIMIILITATYMDNVIWFPMLKYLSIHNAKYESETLLRTNKL